MGDTSMSMTRTSGRGNESAPMPPPPVRVAVGGIIHVRTSPAALEDAVGAVEVALERAAVLLLVLLLAGGKTGGVPVGSTDGRRMVGGLGAVVGLLQGRGRPYDEMPRLIGDDANTLFFFLFY